ncbi:MAG: hypothetical protein KF774_04455 [Planctomyces sp.]|nr:hypothetical protein [Planctomyces sp.]
MRGLAKGWSFRRLAPRCLAALALSTCVGKIVVSNDVICETPGATCRTGPTVVGGAPGTVYVDRHESFMERMRSMHRRMSWKHNTNHHDKMYWDLPPYWLPNHGYYQTTWRQGACSYPQELCPSPPFSVMEGKPRPVDSPDSSLLPLPEPHPVDSDYSPPLAPDAVPMPPNRSLPNEFPVPAQPNGPSGENPGPGAAQPNPFLPPRSLSGLRIGLRFEDEELAPEAPDAPETRPAATPSGRLVDVRPAAKTPRPKAPAAPEPEIAAGVRNIAPPAPDEAFETPQSLWNPRTQQAMAPEDPGARLSIDDADWQFPSERVVTPTTGAAARRIVPPVIEELPPPPASPRSLPAELPAKSAQESPPARATTSSALAPIGDADLADLPSTLQLTPETIDERGTPHVAAPTSIAKSAATPLPVEQPRSAEPPAAIAAAVPTYAATPASFPSAPKRVSGDAPSLTPIIATRFAAKPRPETLPCLGSRIMPEPVLASPLQSQLASAIPTTSRQTAQSPLRLTSSEQPGRVRFDDDEDAAESGPTSPVRPAARRVPEARTAAEQFGVDQANSTRLPQRAASAPPMAIPQDEPAGLIELDLDEPETPKESEPQAPNPLPFLTSGDKAADSSELGALLHLDDFED